MFYEDEYQNYEYCTNYPKIDFINNVIDVRSFNKYQLCSLFDAIDLKYQELGDSNSVLIYNYNFLNKLLVQLGLKEKCYIDIPEIEFSVDDYLNIPEDYFSSKNVLLIENLKRLTSKQLTLLYPYWLNLYKNDISFDSCITSNYLILSSYTLDK